MPTLEDHPLAGIFPLMGDDELKELAADLEANGQRDAVWLLDGQILDGRNRYRASQLVEDFDLRVEHYKGRDPLGFVISKNLRRRHLTESQRAMVAANIAEAKKGKPANLPIKPVTQTEAAERLHVSPRSVRDAVKVKADGVPELVEAVEKGEATVSAAAEVAKLPPAEQKKAVKAGKVKETAAKKRAEKKKPDPATEDTVVDTPPTKPAKVIPPPAVDAWGIPVQEHAAVAFAAVPKFKELLSAIQTAQRLFNEVANLEGGKFLTLPDVSSYRRGKKGDDGEHADRFVHEGLETAYRQVKAATPTHTVCPYQYADSPHTKDCRCCRELNWTPVLGDNVPKVCVTRAKEAFGV